MPLQRDFRFMLNLSGGTPLSAYILGLASAVGWTPCIGPVLGTILAVTATTEINHLGIVLLATYAAGLGVPLTRLPGHRRADWHSRCQSPVGLTRRGPAC